MSVGIFKVVAENLSNYRNTGNFAEICRMLSLTVAVIVEYVMHYLSLEFGSSSEFGKLRSIFQTVHYSSLHYFIFTKCKNIWKLYILKFNTNHLHDYKVITILWKHISSWFGMCYGGIMRGWGCIKDRVPQVAKWLHEKIMTGQLYFNKKTEMIILDANI